MYIGVFRLFFQKILINIVFFYQYTIARNEIICYYNEWY